MKYKTFRSIGLGVVVLAGLGTWYGVNATWQGERAERQQARAGEEAAEKPRAAERATEQPATGRPARAEADTAYALARRQGEDPAGLRAVDRDVLDLLRRPVQAKIKDASKGKPWKINLYSDDGAAFNRAKVDLDRDDKWDESWSFKTPTERKVAPADDENYTEVWVLAGESWKRK